MDPADSHGFAGGLRQRINYTAPGREFWGITVSSGKHNPTLIGAFSATETKPLQDAAKKLLSANPAVSHLSVTASDDLVAGFAALVSYDVRVSASTTYSVRSYWLVSGGRMFILAGVTEKGRMGAHKAAFTRVFKTFRPI